MASFIMGLFVGAPIGVVVMALLQINRDMETEEKEDKDEE